jgi:predicted aspartyl protease
MSKIKQEIEDITTTDTTTDYTTEGKSKTSYKGTSRRQETMKLLLLSTTEFTENENWTHWRAKLIRRLREAEVPYTPNIQTPSESEYSIVNQVIEARCVRNETASRVINQHANRQHERVDLLEMIDKAFFSTAAEQAEITKFINLTPEENSCYNVLAWSIKVEEQARKANLWPLEQNFQLCLVLFASRAPAEWKNTLGQEVWKVKSFPELHELCTRCTTTAITPTPVNAITPKRREVKCFNCNDLGHIATDCPKPPTERTLKFRAKKAKTKQPEMNRQKKAKDKNKKLVNSATRQWSEDEDEESDKVDMETYTLFKKFLASNIQDDSYYDRVCPATSRKSLAMVKARINNKAAEVLLDSGSTPIIISPKWASKVRRRKKPIHIRYGNSNEQQLVEESKIGIEIEGKKFQVWAYISNQCPFPCIAGEEFLQGRVSINYITNKVHVEEEEDRCCLQRSSKIPVPAWGEGRPRSELLHRNSTPEEQEAVLVEELGTIKDVWHPRLKTILEKNIRRQHERNKSGWVASKWEPYEIHRDTGKSFTHQRQYKYDSEQTKFIQDKLQMWDARGFTVESRSPFAVPIVCADKPQPADERMRLAGNFKETNKVTHKSEYELPIIEDIADKTNKEWFSTIDNEEGYHKMRITNNSSMYNSVKALGVTRTALGALEGTKNAGNHYQKCMERTLLKETKQGVALGKFAWCFQDDTVINSNDVEKHVDHIEDVLERFWQEGVKPKWRKCRWLQKKVKWCGRLLSKEGIELDKDTVDVLLKLDRPKCWREMCMIHGMLIWCKEWIENFQHKTAIFRRYLVDEWKHKRFKWTEELEEKYIAIIEDIRKSNIRARSGPGELHLLVDWSQTAGGWHLQRWHKGTKLTMRFGGKVWRGSERNMSPSLGELYNVSVACRKWKKHLLGRKLFIHMDCKAWKDFNVREPNKRVQGWLKDIMAVAPEGVYIQGKLNTVADTISRLLTNTDSINSIEKIDLPTDMRKMVLDEYHKGKEGGHMSNRKMYELLKMKYEWEGMHNDIMKYSCNHCQHYKKVIGRYANRKSPMKSAIADRPWQKIGFDLEEMSINGRKYKYLIMICFFTGLVEAAWMNNGTGKEVVKTLRKSNFWQVSVPEALVSDEDTATSSDEFKKFIGEAGVKFKPKAAYHHEGKIENTVKTFKRILEAKSVEGTYRPDSILKVTCGAMNSSVVSSSSKFTANMLAYGVEKNTELDNRIRAEIRRRSKLVEIAKSNKSRSKQYQEKQYNKGKQSTKFRVGDKVLVRNEKKHLKVGEIKYFGPFPVIKAKNDKYTLYNKWSGRTYIRNIEALRPWNPKVNVRVKEAVQQNTDKPTTIVARDMHRDEADPHVGKYYKFYWPKYEKWFKGIVGEKLRDSNDGSHLVHYEDGQDIPEFVIQSIEGERDEWKVARSEPSQELLQRVEETRNTKIWADPYSSM